jgi:hypothetical protein
MAGEQRKTSWPGSLQQRLELARIATLNEEAVGIMAIGQSDSTNVHALLSEPAGQRVRRLLATAVGIGIEGQIDGSATLGQLSILVSIEVISHRAGDVVKAGLPQHDIVEQALYEEFYSRGTADRRPLPVRWSYAFRCVAGVSGRKIASGTHGATED